MAASTEVHIGGETADYVAIQPLYRTHPGLFSYEDGNWLTCQISVVSGSFRGSFDACLRCEEFPPFLRNLEALSQTLEGAATFSTMEGQLALTLTGDGKGHVQVTGEAMDEAGTGNRLEFTFNIDQTYLPLICTSLQDLLAAFPVVGAYAGTDADDASTESAVDSRS